MIYTHDLVIAILNYNEEIRELVERTSAHPKPSDYLHNNPAPSMAEYKTLWNLGPRTTRVTNIHPLRESLLDMLVDVDMARKNLEPMENICLSLFFTIRPLGRPTKDVKDNAYIALDKVVKKLNGELND